MHDVIDVDYLIIGAGTTGMGFADSLLTASDATMAIVDRHDRPGGHWNDAYPFVRLHQPAALYGVNSHPLGSGEKDEVGLNKGLYELASGQEVLNHFDFVMQHRFLPSGRVQYFPMCEVDDAGTITSRLSGQRVEVRARKTVDGTYSQVSVPSTHRRQFDVAEGVTCGPLNELPRLAPAHSQFVVIGAGKTGMDACLWLLANGADPDAIRWVMPRDAWLLNRANFQPGMEFLARGANSIADQVEALALAESVDDLFQRLEAKGEVLRVDPSITPTAYHCATVSDDELEALRQIGDVIRLGRVERIETDRIVLEGGEVVSSPDALYVDCSAIGIPNRQARPVFEGDRITLQFVRFCQPAFSASLIGHVEASFSDDDSKNGLCAPIAPASVPFDYVRMVSVELANRHRWSKDPVVATWIAQSRLDGFTSRLGSLTGSETEVFAHLQRYGEHVVGAVKNVKRLLATQ
ncbi:MAG TPA: NAD(P)/FAD-dependent oxidoreductase [Acidimicrobiales bacterium]|nr:NAD(P)/FAD-dependent oxidoreductase [Acidimicrobiales bacterium]